MHTNPSKSPHARRLSRATRAGVTASAVGAAVVGLSATSAHAAEGHEVVEVAEGDTLTDIAAAHGLDPVQGWREIAAATPGLGNPDVIVAGQEVRVPSNGGGEQAPEPQPEPEGEAAAEQAEQAASAPDPGSAQVQDGDTLAAIAAAHDVADWRRIFDANPQIQDPNRIPVGAELRIPSPEEELDRRPLPASQPSQPEGSVQQQSAGQPEPVAQPQQDTTTSSSPAPSQSQPAAQGGGVWDQLAQCESGGNWNANTGNGFYGGLQFTQSSWQAVGGQGLPHQASKAEQIQRAEQLRAQQGWGAWPACSRQLGLR